MDNEIYNNDDCNINVINVTDAALELTKLYYQVKGQHGYVTQNENLILETYLKFRKEIREDIKNEN